MPYLMRYLNLLLLAVAGLILFFMLKKIDWVSLGYYFLQSGRYWPLLLIPYGLICYLWSLSWGLLLVEGRGQLSMRRLFMIRLAGESLNQLTPTACLGGEPYKALRLRNCGVSWQEAAASLMIQKALMVLSLVLYICFCIALIPFALPSLPFRIAVISSVGALFLGGGGIAFVLAQRRNPCGSLIKLLSRFGICPAVLREKEPELATLDQFLAEFYRKHPGKGYLSFFCLFLGWALHAAEVYLIFKLLGHPISIQASLCLDALSQLVAGLGFMIPASLGVQDGGNILLSLGFNLGATLGAAFSVMRRFREAFWLLLGLLVAARAK